MKAGRGRKKHRPANLQDDHYYHDDEDYQYHAAYSDHQTYHKSLSFS